MGGLKVSEMPVSRCVSRASLPRVNKKCFSPSNGHFHKTREEIHDLGNSENSLNNNKFGTAVSHPSISGNSILENAISGSSILDKSGWTKTNADDFFGGIMDAQIYDSEALSCAGKSQKGEPVLLRVYDLSNGHAARWSKFLLGQKLDGVWHSGLNLFGREYFYGSGMYKMRTEEMEQFFQMRPQRVHVLGFIHLEQCDFERYLLSIKPAFTAEFYDLVWWNCNDFTDVVCRHLFGRGIPLYVLEPPKTLAESTLGKLVVGVMRRYMELRSTVSPCHPRHPRNNIFDKRIHTLLNAQNNIQNTSTNVKLTSDFGGGPGSSHMTFGFTHRCGQRPMQQCDVFGDFMHVCSAHGIGRTQSECRRCVDEESSKFQDAGGVAELAEFTVERSTFRWLTDSDAGWSVEFPSEPCEVETVGNEEIFTLPKEIVEGSRFGQRKQKKLARKGKALTSVLSVDDLFVL